MSELLMFNGLIMCGDSDTSDFTKESACASSAGSGECEAAARAQHYHNQLLAALQILRNKEETVRVQSESLQLAETRITALTERAAALRADLNDKVHELKTLRQVLDAKNDKSDFSVSTDIQEMENQKSMVSTLQSNLSVIEELYRECFYETAKQEEIIEMLRKSCLDVRLMDREKTEQIGRLQNVVHSQKWSLEQCHDIALEVDNLKLEISNFLNSSNNDSGVWERSEESPAAEVSEELQDITAQLLRLQHMLTTDCTCGLEEENLRLKQNNEAIELQMGDLRQRVRDLETSLLEKDGMYARYQQQLEEKEKELVTVREQLKLSGDSLTEKNSIIDSLTRQILQTQVMLSDKTEELVEVQRQCTAHEDELVKMHEELDKANNIIKENDDVRGSVCRLSSQVRCWREQLCASERRVSSLHERLQEAAERCRHADTSHREACENARALQAQLEEAHERGASLCAEARHALTTVRRWVQRMRTRHSEQEEKIKEQEMLIDMLQERLQETQNVEPIPQLKRPCCSKCVCQRNSTMSAMTFAGPSRVEERQSDLGTISGSEIASGSSAPIPPKRMLRKKALSCPDRRCGRGRVRTVGVQQPARRHVAAGGCDAPHVATDSPTHVRRAVIHGPANTHVLPDPVRHVHHAVLCTPPRSLSPGAEVLERVERLQAALCAGRRRWQRPHT